LTIREARLHACNDLEALLHPLAEKFIDGLADAVDDPAHTDQALFGLWSAVRANGVFLHFPDKRQAVEDALAALLDKNKPQPLRAEGDRPPLTENESMVLTLIKNQEPDGGITGKQIQTETGISQGTLTRHIIPRLKQWYGVKNRPGAGYYLPKSHA
jgi:hypothetical protein